eukprot:COSAG02_NODE_2030_length_10067_cov_22.885333_11_plen_69_part_00
MRDGSVRSLSVWAAAAPRTVIQQTLDQTTCSRADSNNAKNGHKRDSTEEAHQDKELFLLRTALVCFSA